jgi:AsmA protein
MNKLLKILLISIGGLVLLLAVAAASVIFLFDPNEYKPQLQAAASEALGMQVNVKGPMTIRFYPGLRLAINDVEILDNKSELVAVEEIRVGLELLPLLQKQYHIKSVSLLRPVISLESGAAVSKQKGAEGEVPAVELAKISISDGAFSYLDKQSGEKLSAKGCDITVRNLRLGAGKAELINRLSFGSSLHCGTVNAKPIAVTNVKLSLNAKDGVFDVKPITLNLLGGEGSGDMRADYTSATPKYKVRFALPHFAIDELLKTLSSEVILAGPVSFSMDLSLQGKSAKQIERSASGSVVLQGKGLKLQGYDLDTVFSRFESSQSFNLLDMGALLVAGPAGVALTKGKDFAGILTGAEGETGITKLVTRWKVKQGVMHASDVAMATAKHRIALLGGIDVAGGRFADITVALIDSKGCAQVQQKIDGPFNKPVMQQPSAVKAVAAPVLNVFKKGKDLLAGDNCKVIYSGEVTVPSAAAK